MDNGVIQKKLLYPLMQTVPHSLRLIDYDHHADGLYISFKRPQIATETGLLDNGILLRYRAQRLDGVTVLDASKRSE